MKPDIRLIGLDLDGTTLDSQKRLTPAVAAAIKRAMAAGITVLPVTGRSFDGIPDVIRRLAGIRYAVVANGAEIYDLPTGKVLYGDYFSRPTALSILADCHRLRTFPAALMEGTAYAEWTDFGTLAGQLSPATVEYLKSSRKPVDSLEEKIKTSAFPVAKFTMVFPELVMRPRAMQHFEARGDCTVTSSFDTNLELNTATANKGAGLLEVARLLSIPQPQVMAIGDGLNDIAMLTAAGYSVAMQNSIPQAIAAAHTTTKSCDEDGVACAINAVLDG